MNHDDAPGRGGRREAMPSDLTPRDMPTALDNMLRRWQSWARLALAHIPSAAPMVREQYDALLTDTVIVRAAHQRLTAPDTQTEGDDAE